MVYRTDGRPVPVYNTPAGPMSPLAYTPGAGQNPTQLSPGEDLGGRIGGAIGGILGGQPGALIGGIGGALLGGLADGGLFPSELKDWGGPVSNIIPPGYRLVSFRNGVWLNTIFGPSAQPARWKVEPSRIRGLKLTLYPPNGRVRVGYSDPDVIFALVNELGAVVGQPDPRGGYQPGRTLDPDNPDNDGLPDNPLDNQDFAVDLNGAIRDALEQFLNEQFGRNPDGSKPGDGDEDDDGKPDEEENGDDDSSCQGKKPLEILKATVDQIYKILGGDLFGGDKCKPGGGDFRINPEQFLRNIAGECYSVTGQGAAITLAPGESEVSNYPQLIAALLSVSYMRGGHYRYPSQVQDSIVVGDSNIFGDLFGKPQRTLADQQAYHQWFLEQFDATLGRWQQTIRIVDTDLEQPGDQSKTVRLPNLAEAVADLYTLVFDIKTTNDTALNFLTRLALEQACLKKEVIVTQKWAELISDYLGPKVKDVKVDLPLLFTLLSADGQNPSEQNIKARNNISTILEASRKPIIIPELAQPHTLQADLQVFKQASAIVRASLAQSFGNRALDGIRRALIDQVKAAAASVDMGNDETGEQPAGGDFSSFLTEAEQGFIGTPGITDTNNPYGRPLNQRPRIREIGRDGDDS